VLASPWVYTLFNLLSLGALIGLVWLAVWHLRSIPTFVTSAHLWLLVWLVVLVLEWLRYESILVAVQGRLLFPAIAAIAIFMATGLLALVPLAHRRAFVVGVGAVLWCVCALVVWLDIRPAYTPAPLAATVPASAARERIRFGELLELVGFEVLNPSPLADERLDVAVYWKVLGTTERNDSIFVHVLDADGFTVAQRDTYPGLGLRPTSQLHPGEIVRDVYSMVLSAAQSNTLDVHIGVYDLDSGTRLSTSPPATDNAPLVQTVNLRPRADANAPTPLQVHFGGYFDLVGYKLNRAVVKAGESVTLSLTWKANRPSPVDYSIFTHVLGKRDALWGQVDRQLATTTWQSGETINDEYTIPIKPETPPGFYQLEVGAYDLAHDLRRLDIWGADGQYVGDHLLVRPIKVIAR
ncbi:MAG: hypothetical protein LC737_01725, partial [Chloroflexi bacterium]|nr:hypothetical protein [Chloroflexota bacterium]